MHLAFKCTYCDGGQGKRVGFAGTCSDETIRRNVREGRVWCRVGPCGEYCKNGFSGERPQGPCYESILFKEWWFCGGIFHSGPRAGQPMPIQHVEEGDIAIFTSRFPDEPREEQRRIVGLFLVGQVLEDQEGATYVEADSRLRIRLPMASARKLYFWDYYRNASGGPKWGSGLFRYLRNDQVARLLADAQMVLASERDRSIAAEMYETVFGGSIESAPFPCTDYPVTQRTPIAAEATAKRKYGGHGEGEAHRALKEWVAANPEFLDLRNVSKVEMESHVFPCGDQPDIVFHLDDGRIAVVEVETAFPMPGAYQAIKYRSLACAETGRRLDSPDVMACLVAWDIPADVRAFCGRYDIRVKTRKL